MAELLLELFSEEIPARMQIRAAEDLKRLATDALKGVGLQFAKANAYVTPRRLTLVVDGLPLSQPDVREERKGPRVDAPSAALQGFVKAIGGEASQIPEMIETTGGGEPYRMTAAVTVSVVPNAKGNFYLAHIEKSGRPTDAVLAELMPNVLAALPWPKSMRWGMESVRWVRPLHSIVCLLDGHVVSFEFGPVMSGKETRGHRFLAPALFEVKNFADYKARLRTAYVMLDPAERAETIWADADAQAKTLGLMLKEDRGLLEEVMGLVEWPVPLIGSIDESFMDVPAEVLTTAMRTHQKYFALLKADGGLAPKFVAVANMLTDDGGKAVIAGNERVLRARLSDARFFWDQDRKIPLAERVPALKDIIFHAKLGTMGDKVERIVALAVEICPFVRGADRDRVRSAAELCKADLVTGMVGEFPELQGIMGRYYALQSGEAFEVADAVAEHYAPKGPNDRCPTAPVSVAVALADKIDTLVGFFAVGEKPTGSGDPFALRRAALGVIRLVLENKLRVRLKSTFVEATKLYRAVAAKFDRDELLSFFADRLKVALREKGVRHDLIDAVFALDGQDDLTCLVARVEALGSFLASDDGGNLLTAYRRAANIVAIEEKKDKTTYAGAVDAAKLSAPEEKTLHQVLEAVNKGLVMALAKEDFTGAMSLLATLRRPVDAFFDKVTVNADDKVLRANRLRLLAVIRDTMNAVADFSKIEG